MVRYFVIDIHLTSKDEQEKIPVQHSGRLMRNIFVAT